MPLRALCHQGVGERDENAAADIADKIDQSRHLVVLLRRNSEISGRGHGDKDKGDSDDLDDAQLGGKTETNEQAEVLRSVEIPEREDHEAERDQVPRRESAYRLPCHGHGNEQHQSTTGKGQPGDGCGVAELLLQKLRLQHSGRIQQSTGQQHKEGTHREILELEQAQINQRSRGVKFPNDQCDEGDDEGDGKRHNEVRSKPVLFLAFIERDLQRTHRDDQQANPDVVDAVEVLPIRLLERRIFYQPIGKEYGQNAYRNVDIENPMHGVVAREPSAEGRPNGRGQHRDQSVERKGEAALRRLERISHDGLRHRLQSSASYPLQYAEEQQKTQGRSDAAQK